MSGNLSGGKDHMHPEDIRNMFIFFIIAAILYMGVDAFVLKPQADALRKVEQARIIQQQIAIAETTPLVIEPREKILESSPRITIQNTHIKGSLNLKGARIDDLALSNYFETLEKKDNVLLLSPKNSEFARYIEYGWTAENTIKTPNSETNWTVQGNNVLKPGQPVTLTWDNGSGQRFENIYTIDENFLIMIEQKIINKTGQKITLHPYGLVTQTGLPNHFQGLWVSHEGPMGYIGDELVQITYGQFRKTPSKFINAYRGWTGITDKYWLAALIPAQNQATAYHFNRSGALPIKKEKEQGRFQSDFAGPPIEIAANSTASYTSHAFLGAKKIDLLKSYGKKLDVKNFDLAVDFGWFWFLSIPFYWALHYLHELVGNMGIAIILLTIIIRSSVFPLTNLSYKSFGKMKKITPEIAALRDTYGNDKTKLQEELVKLYQREGVSPIAGCLPIFLQIPIFFALYKVLVVTIEMRHAPFFGWIKDLSAADPTNVFNLFGLIAWDPPGFMHIGVWPCFLLMAFLMQKQLNPPPQDPIQRDMAVYFPFLMCYMMAKFASGLVIYWTFSALIGVAQQSIIMHRMGIPIHFLKSREEKRMEKDAQKGVGAHPLLEMAEKNIEDALLPIDEAPPNISSPKPRRKKKK